MKASVGSEDSELFESAGVEQLPDGSLVVSSSKVRLWKAICVSLMMPAMLCILVAGDYLNGTHVPLDTLLGVMQGASLFLVFLLVPAYFAFRWRRIVFTPDALIHQTLWRGGFGVTRRFPWQDVARLGLIDWDDLSLALNIRRASGQTVHLRAGSLPKGFERALALIAQHAPVPERIRDSLLAAIAERSAFVENREPVSAEAIPPEKLPGHIAENSARRIVLTIAAGTSDEEEVCADAGGLEVRGRRVAPGGASLRSPISAVHFAWLGSAPSGSTGIEVESAAGDRVRFGAKLHGAASNWLQARLASVWGLKWLPIKEGSKFGRYLSPARFMEETGKQSSLPEGDS